MDEHAPSARAEKLRSAIESILLVATEPVSPSELASATGASRAEIRDAIVSLRSTLTGGIRLQEHEGRLQLTTAPENVAAVQRFMGAVRPAPLSRGALETLAVVAYRQPVTRSEIEEQRGVDSDRALRTLVTRELVHEVGRRSGPGRPVEYGTTSYFLEYFGLQSLRELPSPQPELLTIDASSLGFRNAKSGQDEA